MAKQWIAALLLLWGGVAEAEELCAVVAIEIAQELSFERQAFEATMRINNGLDTISLEDLTVSVTFEDEDGDVAVASSDPDAEGASFFIRLDDSQSVSDLSEGVNGSITDGSVAAKASGVLRWLIIPTAGAAGDELAGKRYLVGASISYNAGGKIESLTVTPDSITVRQQPKLALDYFLTREVIADDAFTPGIEPAEPYTLGVRVRNSGNGMAAGVKLESAQPRIVANDLDLAVNYLIKQSFVDDKPAQPTLMLDFGNIEPGSNRMGRWLLESNLSGKFIDFSASFSHPDELGGRMTSLLESTSAHFLLRDVLVDISGRDGVRDFLANVGDDLYVFESEPIGQAQDAPCIDCQAVTTLSESLEGSGTTRRVELSEFGVPVHVKMPDPYQGTKALQRVLRQDSSAVSGHNAWLSKERAEDGINFEYFVNIFDPSSQASYSLEFGELSQEPKPPVFMSISDRSAHEGGQLGFLVRATDPNGTSPRLTVEGLPTGATFKDEGQGRATFNWQPQAGQAGRYVVTFIASDGELNSSLPVGIRIFRQGDTDGDGMDDAWELQHFGTLDRDGNSDLDGDGLSDLLEFEQGGNPAVADATPLPPRLLEPQDNAEVAEQRPLIRVANTATPGNRQFSYLFELYADEAMTRLVAKSPAISQGGASTEWRVQDADIQPEAELLDNHRYYWRVRVQDEHASSEWLNARLFLNAANDAPSQPLLLTPTPLGLSDTATPLFQFSNSTDVDEDALSYRVRVFAESDEQFSQPIAEISGLLPGEDGTTEWQSPIALEENQFYLWLVEAVDEHGAVRASEPSLFGISLSNDAPSVPVLAWPEPAQSVIEEIVSLRFGGSVDPERQSLEYRVQLDLSDRFDSEFLQDSGWLSANAAGGDWTPQGELAENQIYHWRVQASDGEQMSMWRAGHFRVNRLQELPGTPVLDNPANSAWVESRQPRLSVHPAIDPDGDSVSYEFELYAAGGDERLASQVVTESYWVPSLTLDDHQSYRWRVRAIDSTSLASTWSEWSSFFINENGIDDAPSLTFIEPGVGVTLSGGTVLLQWVDADPDSSAMIDLYANDQLIASGLPEDADGDADRFEWSLAGLQPGSYELRAVIRDANSQSSVSACCSVELLPPAPEIQVRPLGDPVVDEYGEQIAEIEVQLSRGPEAGKSVTLNLTVSNVGEARLLNEPGFLYFTAENWHVPQRIRVQGVDDCSIDGSQPVGIELLPLHSADPAFEGLDPVDVLLTNQDNEQEGQSLFICHYQIVSRSAVDVEGKVEIELRPELLNLGPALKSAQAEASANPGVVEISATSAQSFSSVLTAVRSVSQNTLRIRQDAALPTQFQRLHWQITAGDLAPVTQGQSGNDTLTGSTGDDIIEGLAGDDIIKAGGGNDTLIGGAGGDTLFGEAGNDRFLVTGSDVFADLVSGGSGYDSLLGGDSDDIIRLTNFTYDYRVELVDGRGGSNRIEGTPGADSLNFSETEIRNIELINGLAGNDQISGAQTADVIRGGAGDDSLTGNAGDDSFLVDGDEGVDQVSGGTGYDQIRGSEGDDWIRLKSINPASGIELIDGGEGLNYLTGDATANTLDLQSIELRGIARIDGLDGSDVIVGSAQNDLIQGGAGDDTLTGMGGDDVFFQSGTGSGFDQVQGGEGNDGVKGGSGDDSIGLRNFTGDNRVEWIDGDGGVNKVLGSYTPDTLDFRQTRLMAISEIDAGGGNDTVYGSGDADVIRGGTGADQLYGEGGDDIFPSASSQGDDRFYGGDGYDRIVGTDAGDTLGILGLTPESSIELIDGGAGWNQIYGHLTEADLFDFSSTELKSINTINGRGGDDVIRGSAQGNSLRGDVGNDQLSGRQGDDTYIFYPGHGQDVISDQGLASDNDRLIIYELTDPYGIWLEQVDGDLRLSLQATSDSILLQGQYSGAEARVESLWLNPGWTLTADKAAQLAEAMRAIPRNPAERTSEQQAQLKALIDQFWVHY